MSGSNPYVPPSVASGPKAPALRPSPPVPGSSLDFGGALGFFFRDPNWGTKLLVGSLFAVLSMFVVGGIFIAGYAVRLVRRTARGEPYPLPEWEDLGGMFMEGLAVVGAYLAHLMPVVVVAFTLFVPIALLEQGQGEPSPAVVFVVVPLMLVAGLACLTILLYFPAALTRFAVEERFAAAFEVGNNWAFIRRNFSNYLLAIAVFLVASYVSQFGFLLLCLGIFPATFWSQCVGAYAFGEVVLRDPGATGSVPTS